MTNSTSFACHHRHDTSSIVCSLVGSFAFASPHELLQARPRLPDIDHFQIRPRPSSLPPLRLPRRPHSSLVGVALLLFPGHHAKPRRQVAQYTSRTAASHSSPAPSRRFLFFPLSSSTKTRLRPEPSLLAHLERCHIRPAISRHVANVQFKPGCHIRSVFLLLSFFPVFASSPSLSVVPLTFSCHLRGPFPPKPVRRLTKLIVPRRRRHSLPHSCLRLRLKLSLLASAATATSLSFASLSIFSRHLLTFHGVWISVGRFHCLKSAMHNHHHHLSEAARESASFISAQSIAPQLRPRLVFPCFLKSVLR